MGGQEAKLSLSTADTQAYLLALLSAIAADGVFSTEEIIRIYTLFALLSVQPSTRLQLLESLICGRLAKPSVGMITAGILENDTARTSLAKDLMFLESKSEDNQTLNMIRAYLRQLKLTPEQASVIRNFVDVENQILDQLGAGKEWQADGDSWKELVSRAAAVGVPLAALNMAGLAGFSAVGITSGLAALGSMSGLAILGLNPMTAGIGALILGGVAVKKIADYALSGDAGDQSQLNAFQQSRLAAKEALTADQSSVRRSRKREFILIRRARRRRALITGMDNALAALSVS
jgi:hypothetical protein